MIFMKNNKQKNHHELYKSLNNIFKINKEIEGWIGRF